LLDLYGIFKRQGITKPILWDLDLSELHEIGLNVGQRKRYLKAKKENLVTFNKTTAGCSPADGTQGDCPKNMKCYTDKVCDLKCSPINGGKGNCPNNTFCNNNGECGAFKCTTATEGERGNCPEGHICGKDKECIDPCALINCTNGETCQGGICKCGSVASCGVGETCTNGSCIGVKEDPCLPKPCLNGATCSSDENNEYQCECPDGYTGDKCENGQERFCRGLELNQDGICTQKKNCDGVGDKVDEQDVCDYEGGEVCCFDCQVNASCKDSKPEGPTEKPETEEPPQNH